MNRSPLSSLAGLFLVFLLVPVRPLLNLPSCARLVLLAAALLLPAPAKAKEAGSTPLPVLEQNAVINQPFSLRLFLTTPTEIIFIASLDKTYFSNFTSKRDETTLTFSFLPIRSGTTSLLFSRINKNTPLRYVKYHLNLFETPAQLRAAKEAAAHSHQAQPSKPHASSANQITPPQKTEFTSINSSQSIATEKAEDESSPVVKKPQAALKAATAYFKALMEEELYAAAEEQLLTLAPASGTGANFFLTATEQLAKAYTAQGRQAKAEELLKKLVGNSRNETQKTHLRLIEVRMYREKGAFEVALARLEELGGGASSLERSLTGAKRGAAALPATLQAQLHFERGALFYRWNKGSLAAAEYKKYFQLLEERETSASSEEAEKTTEQVLTGYYQLAQLYETHPPLLDYEAAYNFYMQLQKHSQVHSAYHRLATEKINFIKRNFFEVR